MQSRSREQLWSKTLSVYCDLELPLAEVGKEVQSKILGMLKKCLEQGMDEALPAVLTLAVCIYDN